MIFVVMTADGWEAAFHGIDLPETIDLGPGIFLTDVRGFLDHSLTILRAGNVRVSEPVEWKLQKLLDLLNQQNGLD